MKNIALILLLGVFPFCCYQTPAQDDKNRSQESELEKLRKEVRYIAPIRYAIVYNFTSDLGIGRRDIDVLMDENQFNKENLIKVFELIKKRFPSPTLLYIKVHTNLSTIETPEEIEMASDNTNRLFKKFFLYKMANYFRFNDGTESFEYTIAISPYRTESVSLKSEPIAKPK